MVPIARNKSTLRHQLYPGLRNLWYGLNLNLSDSFSLYDAELRFNSTNQQNLSTLLSLFQRSVKIYSGFLYDWVLGNKLPFAMIVGEMWQNYIHLDGRTGETTLLTERCTKFIALWKPKARWIQFLDPLIDQTCYDLLTTLTRFYLF